LNDIRKQTHTASTFTMTTSSAYSWLPPTYDLSTKPELRYTFAIDDEKDNENFARNIRWYGTLPTIDT